MAVAGKPNHFGPVGRQNGLSRRYRLIPSEGSIAVSAPSDLVYFRVRALEERLRAARTRNGRARAVHLDLALKYEQRALGLPDAEGEDGAEPPAPGPR